MERIFANLVDQFASGRISRRDLIQSLTVAAAVTALGDGAKAAAPRRELNAIAVNHISYQVKDYGRSRDFYAKNFGMKVSHDDGKRCRLSFGDTVLMPRNAPVGAATPQIDHIAYTINNYGANEALFAADNAAVEAELKARGLAPAVDKLSWLIKDPDGFTVQVAPILMRPGNPLFEKEIGNGP